MITDKEKERRRKISFTLKEYFATPQGKQHREMLSAKQRDKMKYLYHNENKEIKNNRYDKKI